MKLIENKTKSDEVKNEITFPKTNDKKSLILASENRSNNYINNSNKAIKSSAADSKKESTVYEEIEFLNRDGNIKNAKEHGLSNRVYKIQENIDPNINIDCCHCCGLILPNEGIVDEYPLCTSLDEMINLGDGIFLYFFYMKFLIICLFTIIGMYSIIQFATSQIYLNEIINYNPLEKNHYSFYNYSSTILKDYDKIFNTIITNNNTNNCKDYENFKNNYVDYSFLNFIMMTTLLIINIIFCILAYNLQIEKDIEKLSIEDYTLMISNIPFGKGTFSEIKELLTIDGIGPVDISVAYKVTDYIKLKKENDELIKNIKICKKELKEKNSISEELMLEEMKKQSNLKNIEIDSIKNKFKNEPFCEDVFSGVIFASFNTVKESNKYYNLFPKSIFEIIHANLVSAFYYVNIFDKSDKKISQKKKILLEVQKVCEPDDIIWENLEFSKLSRFTRIILMNLLTLLLIGCSFIIIVVLTYYQQNSFSDGNNTQKTLISVLISIVISLINFLIAIILKKFSEKKLFNYKSIFLLFNQINNRKLVLNKATFLSSAIVPYFSIYYNNYKISVDNNKNCYENYNYQKNLVNNLLIIFISNSFVSPLLILFPPDYFYLLWLRRSIQKDFINGKESDMTQDEMNEIFENPDIDISHKFAYLAKTMCMTFFFLPLFPFGSLVSLFGIVFLYLIENYNIKKFYKIPGKLDKTIAMEYFYYFKIFMYLGSVSCQIFVGNIFSSWSLVCLIVFGVIIIIPFEKYMKNILQIKEHDVYVKDYKNVYHLFQDDFIRSNPITKYRGQKKFLEAKFEAGDLTEEELIKLKKQIKTNRNDEDLFRLNYTTKKKVQKKIEIEKYKQMQIKKIKSIKGEKEI